MGQIILDHGLVSRAYLVELARVLASILRCQDEEIASDVTGGKNSPLYSISQDKVF